MRLILFGAPGSGKGTQAKLLTAEFGVQHISTGDVLRSEVAARTDLGQRVAGYLSTGQLVPDDVVTDVIFGQLARPAAAGGFILDGYPRTIAQATALTEHLNITATPLDAVVALRVDAETVMTRMLGRGRADDTESIIRDRMNVFHAETMPLFDHYRAWLVDIDASGDVDEVYARLRAAVHPNASRDR